MFLKEKEDRRNASLLDANRSILLIVDAQEKFLPVTPGMADAAKRMVILVKAAARLGIPVVASEQYPKGLGSTLKEISSSLPPGSAVLSKLSFSACDVPEWAEAVRSAKRNQFVICGVETHVCVLQTTLDLIQNLDGQVYIVEDAVASRHTLDRDSALRRMESHGAYRVTAEMAAFEWLRKAGTPEFKEIQGWMK